MNENSVKTSQSTFEFVKEVVTSTPAKITGAILGVATISIMAYSFGAATAIPDDNGPIRVEAVKSKHSVLDQLDSIKDSQLEALREQLTQRSSSLEGDISKEQTSELLLSLTHSPVKHIDEFLDVIMSIPPNADTGKRNVAKDAIVPMLVEHQAVTKAYDYVNGPSSAKLLSASGAKGGPSQLSLIHFNHKKNRATYLVITPFVTDNVVVHQLSAITVVDTKIAEYTYIGILQTDSPNVFEDAISTHILQKIQQEQHSREQRPESQSSDKQPMDVATPEAQQDIPEPIHAEVKETPLPQVSPLPQESDDGQ